MLNNNISNGIQASLQRVADLFVQRVKQKLGSGYPSGDPSRGLVPIQDTIVINSPQLQGGQASITITLGGDSAPYAAAYEYGSGMHRTMGAPSLYPIVPKHGKWLVIPRGRWPNYVPPPDVDPVFLRKVMHPGVQQKPYITPTLQEIAPEVRKILASEFKASILLGTNKIEVIHA